MALVTLDEAKTYLRVDSADEDTLINSFLATAEKYCADIGRLSDDDWAEIIAEPTAEDSRELIGKRAVIKTAILYTVGYLFEHREDADHNDLAITLRNLLCFVREGVF